jgi:predicted lipid-binding transport protein (Tim44 family)
VAGWARADRIAAANAKGPGSLFDIFNIFFLILAIVIFIMLRNALGRRTGHERPPIDPYSRPEPAGDEKVVSLPGTRRPAGAPAKRADPPPDIDWDRFVKPGSAAAAGLSRISAADGTFEAGAFLAGARLAYETIVTAFADGDRKALRNLLSKAVYEGFDDAIREREERGERIESNFVGINSAEIVDAALNGDTAQITVQFRSQLISATYDRNGAVTEGDGKAVRDVTEIWTFERDATSRDPNWVLAATEAAH